MALVYKLVLTVPVSSQHGVDVEFKGIRMYSPDSGHSVYISNRKHRIEKEWVDFDVLEISIYIVNDGSEITERIDFMLDEEYTMIPFVPVIDIETGENLAWTVNTQKSEQCTAYIPDYASTQNYRTQYEKIVDKATLEDKRKQALEDKRKIVEDRADIYKWENDRHDFLHRYVEIDNIVKKMSGWSFQDED